MSAGFSREQLDALRRQIEDDYRLDMAALERLQRRFSNSAPAPTYQGQGLSSAGSTIETLGNALPPKQELPHEPQADELAGSLRAMFSSQRK
ncbi:MAG: hypothetical protein WCF17_08440 [Terracidiphilus sp.]